MSFPLPKARAATIPGHACYWSVLDGKHAEGLGGLARQRALKFALEPDLPLPVDEVEACFLTETDGTITACACRRELLEELSRTADIAVPDAIPDWLETEHQTSDFNLLRGEVVSGRTRSARRLRGVTALTLCLCLSVLLTLGFLHRSKAYSEHHAAAADATQRARSLVLPPAGPSAQPASIRLEALLRSTDSLQGSTRSSDFPPASESLAQLLSLWPEGVRLQRLSLGKRDIRIDLTMPLGLDPSTLIERLEAMQGWKLSAPVIRRSSSSTSVSLSLQRAEEAGR